MLLAEVVARFRNAGVPDWFYVVDGGLGTGECVGIEPTPAGWSVYYSERGSKSPLEICPDEDAACRSLLRRVDRMMRDSGRGSVPSAE
jgi:hypothetical protein